MLTNGDIRRIARESLKGNWLQAVLIFIIAMAIIMAISYIPTVGPFAVFIIGGPLALGIYMYYIGLVRGEKPPISSMFNGFSYFVSSFLLYVLISIFTFLWMLLLIIPGYIAALKYSQAFFIMIDNPNIGAMEAIKQSKQMMEGHKTRLFMLYLSFIGWILLSMVTMGIAMIWVGPYMYAAMAAFYEDLKNRKETYASTDFSTVQM